MRHCNDINVHLKCTYIYIFPEKGYSITVPENEDGCLDCGLRSVNISKCHFDIWYKLDCVATSQRDEHLIFMRNAKLKDTVIRNKLDFSFNESDGRLYISNVTYNHGGLYLRENVCAEEEGFVFIRLKGMSF